MTQLFRDLRAALGGLSGREAGRRLEVSGPNELARRGRPALARWLVAQFTQPLAILLAVAAVLAWVSGTPRLAIAIAAAILLNAAFAFAQEMQAERAVEALAAFLPERARVLRDGIRQETKARLLVPGDVLLIEEGESICADARLITSSLEVDMSTLTGESAPVTRSAGAADPSAPLLQASDVGVQRNRLHRREGQALSPGSWTAPRGPAPRVSSAAGCWSGPGGFLGLISATLVMTGFFLTLCHAGWHPCAATGPGTLLHHAYQQATTVAWLGIVACQIGTARDPRQSAVLGLSTACSSAAWPPCCWPHCGARTCGAHRPGHHRPPTGRGGRAGR